MAKYSPIIKTLKKARPTIRLNDDVVKEWEIEVEYAYDGDQDLNLPAWKTTYSERKDVEYMEKIASQFSKEELIGFMDPIIESDVFEAHYDSQNIVVQPVVRSVEDFDIDSLN